ncbi:tripartite tricarboxylate transporter substrate binding protein [Egibacter rhizosphaerae]|uniref:Tripartite tricarboxylate transporter substrate binding protein n=1 Tax=Egibacter rhizosphaerae TaxID=1670831 RepID=A0A411YJW0_9ACTN|nr:tripartite tricarboxylate transporter substrate binding protein [Egibacter rhizosphaerae]QBI21482.1 tripartite tricarboxylate transporter substrate binding protein [Egibacter rhizosphaerae]
MTKRSALRLLLLVLAGALVLAACGDGEVDDAEADDPDADDTASGQEEVVAEIDEVVAQMEDDELEYDPDADTDEVTEALADVIPQPEDFPARSVEWIVPWGEGGGSDNYARHIGQDAERIMGEDIVYNNMPGASGEVGLGHTLSQAPDGYTIYGAIANQTINDALGIQPYSFVDESEFIIRNQGATEVYWVTEDSELETFDDMIEAAEDNPGDVILSGSGIGSDDEFRMLSLENELGVEFGFVPFDGVGERTSALLGGDVDVLHETFGTVADLYEDGQIRPLAYGGDIVFEDVDPDVPSVEELGYDVPIGRWRGVTAPEGVDQEIVDFLHNVFYASAQLPYYTDYEVDFLQHVAGGYLNSEEFREAAEEERAEVEALVEELDYDTGAVEEELEEDE